MLAILAELRVDRGLLLARARLPLTAISEARLRRHVVTTEKERLRLWVASGVNDIAVRKVTLLTLLRSVGRRRPGRRSFRGRKVHRNLIGARRSWGRHRRALR